MTSRHMRMMARPFGHRAGAFRSRMSAFQSAPQSGGGGGLTDPATLAWMLGYYEAAQSELVTNATPLELNSWSTGAADFEDLYPVSPTTLGAVAHRLVSGEPVLVANSGGSTLYAGLPTSLPDTDEVAFRMAAPGGPFVGSTVSAGDGYRRTVAYDNPAAWGSDGDLAATFDVAPQRVLVDGVWCWRGNLNDYLRKTALPTTAALQAGATMFALVRRRGDQGTGDRAYIDWRTGGTNLFRLRGNGNTVVIASANIGNAGTLSTSNQTLAADVWTLLQMELVPTSASTYTLRCRMGAAAWVENTGGSGNVGALGTASGQISLLIGAGAINNVDIGAAYMGSAIHGDDPDVLAWMADLAADATAKDIPTP